MSAFHEPNGTPEAPSRTVRRARLERELRHFEQMAQLTALDPHLHRETTLWRALAAEVRAYLNPGPTVQDMALLEVPQ